MKKPLLCALVVTVMLMIAGCQDGRPPNEVNSLEDVQGKRIGALSGTPSARLAEELGAAVTFYSGEELLYALAAGMVDCAVLEGVVASELVSGTQGMRILGETLLEYELRFAVPRENAELLAAVNSALTALNANGTLRSLRDKYFSGRNYRYIPPEGIDQLPGDLRLAISIDSPPYSYIDDEGEYTGLDVEIARAVCDYLGVGLIIIEADSRELVTEVWFGRADIAAGWLPGDIDEQVRISDAYADIEQVIAVRR